MPEHIKYNEEQLVGLLKNGDKSAFSYLYDHYSGALYSIIYKMTSNQELSEEVLQEVFVKIWNSFSAYDASKGRLFTWMLNIARNYTIDTIRSKSYKKQSKIQNEENVVDNVANNRNENDKFDSLGLRKQVTLLKEDQRQVIDLSYFEGLTQQEISRQLGIPLSTVKTRIRAGISVLKKILNA